MYIYCTCRQLELENSFFGLPSGGLTPLGLPSLCLLHLPSLGLLVILPLTPFGLLLVYPISLTMASWILGYGFMITCSVMPIWPLFEFI